MIKSTSNERKKEWVAEALRLHHEAYAKLREADKLWDKVGVTLCTAAFGNEKYIHVFSGINKLSELFDKPLSHEDNFGRVDPARAIVKLPSGETCFSIGEPTTPVVTEYVFR